MPTFMYGNMWDIYELAGLFLVTTNGYVTQKGEIVMGRGAALQAKNRWPGLPKAFAYAAYKECDGQKSDGCYEYHLLVSPHWPERKIGAFQVKHSWSEDADLDLIAESVRALVEWCRDHPSKTVHLNYPGIGNGKRNINDIAPLLAKLPPEVHIWRYHPPRRRR